MEDIPNIKQKIKRAMREARHAQDEMECRIKQSQEQQKKMTALLDYREECMAGLENAKTSGLSIVQIREYQLLLRHLTTVLDEQSYKVDLCIRNCEQAKKDYEDKKAQLERQQIMLEQQEKLRGEKIVGDESVGKHSDTELSNNDTDPQELSSEEASEHNNMQGGGLTGKRLKTGS